MLNPPRRFQFRLRSLLLIVAIVAVQCAVCLPALKERQKRNRGTIQWRGGPGSSTSFRSVSAISITVEDLDCQ